jgi:hypothetical protein
VGDEEIDLVRWSLADASSRLDQLEDSKTLVGLLFYLADRRLR